MKAGHKGKDQGIYKGKERCGGDNRMYERVTENRRAKAIHSYPVLDGSERAIQESEALLNVRY